MILISERLFTDGTMEKSRENGIQQISIDWNIILKFEIFLMD